MNRPSTVRRRARGFTLIEILTVLGIASVVSSLAWPSFQSSLQRARRADALVAMTQLQLAQERRYANRRSYGTLPELHLPQRSSGGHYRLEVLVADDTGYTTIARATGTQAGDAECRHLVLTIAGGITTRASGPDDQVANDAAANRRCWGL